KIHRPIPDSEINANVREFGPKSLDERSCWTFECQGLHANLQGSTYPFAKLTDAIQRIQNIGRSRSDLGVELLPRRGELHFSRRSVKKLHPKLVFQISDGLPNRRRRHAEAICSGRKIQGLANGQEFRNAAKLVCQLTSHYIVLLSTV